MLYKVVGIQHSQGNDRRTGAPYDYFRLHCVVGTRQNNIRGQKVEYINVYRNEYSTDVKSLNPDDYIDVTFDRVGTKAVLEDFIVVDSPN